MRGVGIFLIVAALIAGLVGYVSPSQNLEIRTWYDLDAIRNNLDGNYILMNDLDSNTPGYEQLAGPTANGGKGWQPIGTFLPRTESAPTAFNGTCDGQGYEIRDALINRPDEPVVGLFSEVGLGGIIKNLGVAHTYVNFGVTETGPTSAYRCAGGLVGENYGTVDNCYFDGGVGEKSSAGCLVGRNYGAVKNSFSSGQVRGTGSIGGLVGDNGGLVSNCYSTSYVEFSTGGTGGGLVGRNIGGTVMCSYSTGSVHGGNVGGGLVAVNNGSVSRCYATGGVFGKNISSGGLVGLNNGSVSDSYSTGGVSGNSFVGGLVGLNDGSVSNSYSAGSVTGNSFVGGLVGENEGGAVTESFWDTETSGQAASAGGTGKTTAEMQAITTFPGTAWNITPVTPNHPDYSCIWNIVDTATYPFLSWFLGCHEGHTSPTQTTTETTPLGYLQLTVSPAQVCVAAGEQIKIRCYIYCLINTIVDINSVDVVLFDSHDAILRQRRMTMNSPWSAYTICAIVGDEAYYRMKVNFAIRGDGKYSEYGAYSFPIVVKT
ncbi:MAG: hypothetical protein A2Z77_00235 [Chloroflexi bacterium RBG_13_51_36]|nr:MAG: hypothetical protein A2Z77_00235 [Chloroflexi bacterium RBG_13_51_36]